MRQARLPLLIVIAMMLSAGMIMAQAQGTGKAKAKSDKTAAQTDTKSTAGTAEKRSGKLDINTASKQDLEALPGIGPVTAQKIIDNRPYRAKSDLVSRKIIGDKEYAKIKDQIIAHQVKGEATAKSSGTKK